MDLNAFITIPIVGLREKPMLNNAGATHPRNACLIVFLCLFLVWAFGAVALPKSKSSGKKPSRKELDELIDQVWKKWELNLELLRAV